MTTSFRSVFVVLCASWFLLPACQPQEDGATDSTEDADPDDDGNDTDPDDDDEPTGPPVVTVTSHIDGQTVFGPRVIQLAGTLEGGGIVDVTVEVNEGDPMVASFGEETFSLDVSLADRANTLRVEAENVLGETDTTTLALDYPFLAFQDAQPASLVIGQPDFNSGEAAVGPDRFANGPWGHVAVQDDVLYVPDTNNHRLLGFDAVPTANGAAADFVLGQDDFLDDQPGLGQGRMNIPTSVAVEGDVLAVGDLVNARVLVYHGLPDETGAEPDVVVGQPDFDTDDEACTATGLSGVSSVRIVDDKLLVVDQGHNRVLVWDPVPTFNGAAASLVLGQPNFTTCDAGTAADRFDEPLDVWSDGERLMVVDAYNNRVLLWNTFPTTYGAPADVVLGQDDLETGDSQGSTASTFDWPAYVGSNGNQIFVGDCGSRVLVWDAFPSTHGVPADRVLGDPDFETPDWGTSASVLSCPSGFFVQENRLFVSDHGNARVMIFDAP